MVKYKNNYNLAIIYFIFFNIKKLKIFTKVAQLAFESQYIEY